MNPADQVTSPNPAELPPSLSRREQWQLRREEERRAAVGKRRRRSWRRAGWWALVVLLIAAAVGGVIWLAASATPAPAGALADPVRPTDWVRGSRTAPAILVEYSDFQCPACGFYHPWVKQLEQDFGDRLGVVYRHFPLESHPNARPAARAAEAAGVQGKFWEMHDAIFDGQKVWSGQLSPAVTFEQYARSLGLNLTAFAKDLTVVPVRNKVDWDYQSGRRSGVAGTPTFYLNGRQLPNPRSYEEFRRIIEQVLPSQASTTAPASPDGS